MNKGKGTIDSNGADGEPALPLPQPDPAESDPAAPKRRRGYHRQRPAARRRPRPARDVRRAVDLSRLVAVVSALPIDGDDAAQRKRRLLAEMCKMLGDHLSGTTDVAQGVTLAPRLRQTLRALVRGDSEKQIASALGLSPHTVHVYVKQLYKRFNASSRGELLSRFIRGR
jgi:DNA-binding CsgD family transcriptional regulator